MAQLAMANSTEPTMHLIQLAIDKNADMDKLEKLMELHLIHEEREAKKAYHKAMADFKTSPPEIIKDKTVSHSGMSYKHASLGNITESINSELTKYGLSASWDIKQGNDNLIKVICIITHELGHSESCEMIAPPDDSGKKNKIQQIASTVSYLQRYTLLAVTGLASNESDNDGHNGHSGPSKKTISAEQQTALLVSLQEKQVEPAIVCAEFNIKDLSELTNAQFKMCLVKLQNT